LRNLPEAAVARIRAWSARRHGADELPVKIERRRIYILPTRFGLMLVALLIAMLVAGLNYNSNLGLAFAFFMMSMMLVSMHHCHRNLLGLTVDVKLEVDAFAGADAVFYFMLRNESAVDRCDVEVRLGTRDDSPQGIIEATRSVATGSYEEAMLAVPVDLPVRLVQGLDLRALAADRLRRSESARCASAAHCDGGGRRSGALRVAWR
jgi:hypothetical protein